MKNQWGFINSAYKTAEKSIDQRELTEAAESANNYIRAAVARNQNIDSKTLSLLLHDDSRGVAMWALRNPCITQAQYNEVFNRYQKLPYCNLVHPALAAHPLATMSALETILGRNHWEVHLNVINNYLNRDKKAFATLISRFLEKKDESNTSWEILRKQAFLRTYGHHDFSRD